VEQQVMPGADPLGMVIPHGVLRPRFVGVIDSIKRAAATEDDEPAMYRVAPQTSEGVAFAASRAMGVAVRTTGDPMALAAVVRQAVREIDAAAPVHNMMPLDLRVRQNLAQPRFMAIALALFIALAVGTAFVGVYGILSTSVERRRLEIGVRRALGATTPQIARLVVGRALRLSAVGLIVGAGLASAGAQLGRSLLHGISPGDAISYVAAAVAVISMALAGAWLPARAALRIDPARVLRGE
jgi:predicted lysophospholipase L1 biosynthesis ABC-type transport system permease subunit